MSEIKRIQDILVATMDLAPVFATGTFNVETQAAWDTLCHRVSGMRCHKGVMPALRNIAQAVMDNPENFYHPEIRAILETTEDVSLVPKTLVPKNAGKNESASAENSPIAAMLTRPAASSTVSGTTAPVVATVKNN